MDGNPVEEPETSPWANFVKRLAAPAEAEMERLGITNKDEKMLSDMPTAALIAHGYMGMPISRGDPRMHPIS